MESSRKKSYRQVQKRLALRTLALIVALPCFNFLWILHSLGPNLRAPTLILEQNEASRQLASLTKELPTTTTPIVDIRCGKALQAKTVATQAPSVRFRFHKCPVIEQILNTANLGQGHIFPVDQKRQTSDFMSLNEGKNPIEVRFADRVLELTIHRNPSVPSDQTRPAS